MEEKKALVGNAADEEQIKKAEEKVKNAKDIEFDDIRKVMSTPPGRRFVCRYLKFCGAFRTPFAMDSNSAYYQMGQQNVAFKIMGDLNEACPELYVAMINEDAMEQQKKVVKK